MVAWAAAARATIHVVCAGDSITEGDVGESYPEMLERLLGNGYRVHNYGRSGTTAGPEKPWLDWDGADAMLASTFDVAVVMFGANDAKVNECETCWGADWAARRDDFADAYRALLDEVRAANPAAAIYVGVNTPFLRRAEISVPAFQLDSFRRALAAPPRRPAG